MMYDYKKLDGLTFEYFCAELLRKNGFRRVEVTKASGDDGIDVIAYKKGRKYGFQCKKYSSPVGNKAVQEVYAGKAIYDCDVAVVITNSTFTAAATETAEKLGVLLWGDTAIRSLARHRTPSKRRINKQKNAKQRKKRNTRHKNGVVVLLFAVSVIVLVLLFFVLNQDNIQHILSFTGVF